MIILCSWINHKTDCCLFSQVTNKPWLPWVYSSIRHHREHFSSEEEGIWRKRTGVSADDWRLIESYSCAGGGLDWRTAEKFKKNWPHLRNFSNQFWKMLPCLSWLQSATKNLGGQLLSQVLSTNCEQLQNFLTRVEAGMHHCTGMAPIRIPLQLGGEIPGAVETSPRAVGTQRPGPNHKWWVNSIFPRDVRPHDEYIPQGCETSWRVYSPGMWDLMTHKVWAELHKPNARQSSIRLLSHSWVEEVWKMGNRAVSPEEFANLQEFKVAMASRGGGRGGSTRLCLGIPPSENEASSCSQSTLGKWSWESDLIISPSSTISWTRC